MRYLKIIIVAIASIFISACVDLDIQAPNLNNTDEITLIGRMTRFDDYNVATRAAKQGDESKITSYAMAIFSVENNAASECVFYEYHSSGNQLLFTIDRSNQRYDVGKEYAIYVFANMPGMEAFKDSYASTSLETMLAKRYEQTGITLPEDNGFPMIGSLGDYFSSEIDNDGKHFIMSPTAGEEPPTVDGTATTTLSVPMKALYAKMNFHIEVRPDQMIEGSSFPPQFELASYKLINVPASVDFSKSTNADSDVSEGTEGFENNVGVLSDITVDMGNVVASGARAIDFTFYLPENLLVSAVKADEYNYPFKGSYPENVDKDRNQIRDEDEKYCQRYKGKLLGDGQPATCIVLSGNFRDHQNHTVKVDYTIHLGKDNFSDFNIVRNSEYNNDITIKGILNSDDNADNYISLDHRVNVEHTEPNIITLRREVLLDSHFEVRPLRIKYNNGFEGTDAKYVKVEVVNPTKTTWMRLERSHGEGTNYAGATNKSGESIYITDEGASKGKRKYFTYDLVSGGNQAAANYSLVNSTSVTIPIPTKSDENQCVWIYVDECDEVGDAVRSGVIRVTYLDYNRKAIENNPLYPVIDYSINQRKLFQVKYTDASNTIVRNIEYHEEYLHNFDSDETYGHTQYEGMEWGLEGIKLSYDHPALYFKAKTGDWANGIVSYFMGSVPAYYDFYVKKHDESKMADPKQVELHEYDGFNFSDEIIQLVNGVGNHDSESENDIKILSLDKSPKSAVEYCYNKNKRNSEGEVENMLWYLPAIDEIEAIVMSKYGENDEYNTYSRFLDFQDKFYWSSQPAYIQNYAHLRWILLFIPLDYWGTFYFEDYGDTQYDMNNNTGRQNIGSARATKVKYENGNYQTAKSGTNGYYSYYEAEDKEYKYSGTYNGVTIGAISREEGNKARNDMARVRCVRKIN